jgi:hypothetical protein
VYKTKRKYQGEPIRTDPTCDPKENETAIHFNGGDRLAWVSSYEESIVSGLLAHPDFRISELVLMRIERKDSVVGVVGKIPIAALRVGASRESNEHALVIPPLLKDRLFSPSVPESTKEKKAPSGNGEPARTPKRPISKRKSSLQRAAKPLKEKSSQRSKAAKKRAPDNQLPLIPLALNARGNSKKKEIKKKPTTKASAISSRRAKARTSKPVKTKTIATSKSRAQSSTRSGKSKVRKNPTQRKRR